MAEAFQTKSPASVEGATAGHVLNNSEHLHSSISAAAVEAEAALKPCSQNNVLALKYAEITLVFLAAPTPNDDDPSGPSKAPLVPRGVHWKEWATQDADKITRKFRENRLALVGLPCGPAGILVIDCDIKGGVDGAGNFATLVAEHGLPEDVVIVRTLSGGLHYCFTQPEGLALGNSPGALPPGIDVRGVGGYIIAPGTCWGAGGWLEVEGSPKLLEALRDGTLPPPPQWLIDMLQGRKRDAELPMQPPSPIAHERISQSDCGTVGERERAYTTAALDAECSRVANAPMYTRNNTLNASAFALGTAVGAGWLSRGEAETELTKAASACGLPRDEAARTIKSGLDAGELKPRGPIKDEAAPKYTFTLTAQSDRALPPAVNNNTPPDLEIVNAASLADLPIPAQRFHVADLVPHANVTMLGGDGATGKSLLALQLTVATAIGGDWLGLQPEFGKALFVSAEDEIDEVHRRLARIEPNLTLLENLEIVPLAGKDAIIAAPEGRDGLLKETPLFAALKALVKQHKPILLVLDTLADLFGGDEIKKVHARQFIAMLRGLAFEQDCTVLLLSHPSQSGMASGSGTSGNTAWNNSVRSRLYFERVLTPVDGRRVVEQDADLRVLTTKKANRAKAGGTIFVRWQDGKFVRDESINAIDATVSMRAEALFLSYLEQFERDGREVGCKPGANYAPAAFAKQESAVGVGKKDFERAMHRLFQRGKIRNETYGPPSRLRKRIVLVPVTENDEAGADE